MALTVQSFMPSEEECAEALREARWPLTLTCPHCDSKAVNKRGLRGLTQRYHCKDCGKWFNDKTLTPMENSKLPLRTWFFTSFTIQSKVSVKELSKTLDLPYHLQDSEEAEENPVREGTEAEAGGHRRDRRDPS